MNEPISVLDFLNQRKDYPVYLKTFDKHITKVELTQLWEMVSLRGVITDDISLIEECYFEDETFFFVIEDEITYLRRRVKEQTIEIKRLKDSLAYYRDALNEKMNSFLNEVINTFMPRDYSNLNLHSTPLRRGIANALFFLMKRGHLIPEKYVAFMNRYVTRKTIRR